MKLVRMISLIGVLLVGFAITAWFVHRRDVPSASGAFQSSGEGSWQTVALTAAYGFAVTLVGVALGATYRRLIKLRTAGTDRIAPLTLAGDVVTSVDFQIGLVGAPIVYGLLWQSISDIHLAGLSVIALQNGFTSHAILDQLVAEKPSSNSSSAEK
jgi:purine-cytosine permease-like protein